MKADPSNTISGTGDERMQEVVCTPPRKRNRQSGGISSVSTTTETDSGNGGRGADTALHDMATSAHQLQKSPTTATEAIACLTPRGRTRMFMCNDAAAVCALRCIKIESSVSSFVGVFDASAVGPCCSVFLTYDATHEGRPLNGRIRIHCGGKVQQHR